MRGRRAAGEEGSSPLQQAATAEYVGWVGWFGFFKQMAHSQVQ